MIGEPDHAQNSSSGPVHGREPLPVSSFANLARATLLVIAIVAVVWLSWRLSGVLVLFFGAVVVAAILLSLSQLVQKYTPLGSRLSLAVSGLVILLVLFGFGALMGTQIRNQFGALRERVPAAISAIEERLGIDLEDQIASASTTGWVRDIVSYVPDVVGGLASLLLVIVGGIFLAIDPKMYLDGALKLVPSRYRDQVRETASNAGRALKLWLFGKLLTMIAIGVITAIGLYLLGVPSALALGFIAGLLEFVPYIGPILSFVPAGLVAISMGGDSIWWVLGFYVLLQQLENNLLVPLIQQRTVELPPVLGLFALVAMGVLFGPVGVILGTPLTIVLLIAVQQLYVRNTLQEHVKIPGESKAPADPKA